MPRERGITMRTFLVIQTMNRDASVSWHLAAEAVSSTAIEHPEWDLNERRSWDQWCLHFGLPPID